MQKAILSAAGVSLIAALTLTPTIASADHRYHRDWDDGPGFGVYIGPGIIGTGMIGMPMTTDRIGVTIVTTTMTMRTRTENKSNAKSPPMGPFLCTAPSAGIPDANIAHYASHMTNS